MPVLPEPVAAAVAEAMQISQQISLWPGWAPAQVPLVLHGPEVAYLIGHPSPPPGYGPAGSVAGRPVQTGPKLPVMAANTAAALHGHLSALVMLPRESAGFDQAQYARLLLHEAFHVHQQLGLKQVPTPNFEQMSQYPENDPVNNAMAVVENRLLADALAGERQAVSSFLAVRRHRHDRLRALGQDAICVYEEHSEYNEGTPTYVELRAGLPLAVLRARLRESNLGGSGAAYRRFYWTGAAIAMLLDDRLPHWHRPFAQGRLSLQALLLQTAELPLPPAHQVLAESGYAELLQAEQAHEQARQERVAELLARLSAGEGALVEIAMPRLSFAIFDPRHVQVLEPGVRLHTSISGLRTPGACEVDYQGLSLEDQHQRIMRLRLPQPPVQVRQEGFAVQGEGLRISAPAGRLSRRPDGSWLVEIFDRADPDAPTTD